MPKSNRVQKKKKGGAKKRNSASSPFNSDAIDRRGQLTAVRFPGLGFPDRLYATLEYYEIYSFSGSPTPASQVWRANSLFDFNFTGTGHQPRCFDQLTALYLEYLVISLEYEVTVTNTAAVPLLVAFAANDSDQSGNSVDNIAEFKFSEIKTLGPLTSGNQTKTFKGHLDIGAIGGQRIIDSDPSFYSAYNTNPTDVIWCWLKAESIDVTTNVNTTYVSARFYIHAWFKDRTNPAQS